MTAVPLPAGMTGERVPVTSLGCGDVIHVEHAHDRPGCCPIGKRPMDVQVVTVHDPDLANVVVEACACQRFPGARPSMSLVLVLPRIARVLRIGHIEAAAAA